MSLTAFLQLSLSRKGEFFEFHVQTCTVAYFSSFISPVWELNSLNLCDSLEKRPGVIVK